MKPLSRRDFVAGASGCLLASGARVIAAPGAGLSSVEASFYEKLPNRKIKCRLCPRECVIDDRERGFCGVRENRGGTYFTLVHSRPCTFHIDPIEKKPFFHFQPGTLSFSLATAGCNVNCKFCQNWQISQVRPEQVRSVELPPARVAASAVEYSCRSVSYTYSEPVVFYEYMIDSARAVRKLGIRNAVVSNGYIQQDPLKELCAQVDAIKVDLKSFSEKFYREVVNGELQPVLESLVRIKKAGTWLEIVYLIIPTLNDGDAEFRGLAKWVKSELGTDVPVHFTRFHPEYLLKNLTPTPTQRLETAYAIAKAEGLRYIYLGNLSGHPAENTVCPSCQKVVVERTGFVTRKLRLQGGKCPDCRLAIPGIWS